MLTGDERRDIVEGRGWRNAWWENRYGSSRAKLLNWVELLKLSILTVAELE